MNVFFHLQWAVQVWELRRCNGNGKCTVKSECHLGIEQKAGGKCSIYTKLLLAVVYGQSSPTLRLSADPPWYGGMAGLAQAISLEGWVGSQVPQLTLLSELGNLSGRMGDPPWVIL